MKTSASRSSASRQSASARTVLPMPASPPDQDEATPPCQCGLQVAVQESEFALPPDEWRWHARNDRCGHGASPHAATYKQMAI